MDKTRSDGHVSAHEPPAGFWLSKISAECCIDRLKWQPKADYQFVRYASDLRSASP